MTNQKLSKFQPKSAKVIIRKKAAKPMTPDELAERAIANKPKSKNFDLSVLRSVTGSTEPIHLFRAIRALGPKHIPAIIHLLQGADNIKQHSAFSLMQPVYVIIDGTGAYINDYCLSYVIDADANYVRCINEQGTMIASFPTDSTSILAADKFFKIEKDLKPASEKPIRTKSPLVGASDFDPPTINDAIIATRIPKKRLAHSDLYTLFTSFSEGTKITLGTVHDGEKTVKKKKKNRVTQDEIAVAPKSKTLKTDKVRKNMLKGLDLSGYEAEPEKEEPKEVLRQKARIELAARLAENENRKSFMPLLPNAKAAVAITKVKSNKFKNKIELDEDTESAPKKKKSVSKLEKLKSKKSELVSTKAEPKAKAKAKPKAKAKAKETISTKESLSAIRMF